MDIMETCPTLSLYDLEDELLNDIFHDDNYLFYRKFDGGLDDSGFFEVDDCWEVYCTACHASHYIPKKEKPTKLEHCPSCGAKGTPKRWMRRTNLQTRCLYFKFQRGEGRVMWLRVYHVTHSFCSYPGDEHFHFEEVCRYRFDDGIAEKYDHTTVFYAFQWNWIWQKRQTISEVKWRIHSYSYENYPAFVGAISRETIAGSCLEYSQLDTVINDGELSIPLYAALFVKSPCVEYLIKCGCKCLVKEKLDGNKAMVNRAVNFKAKSFKQLFRGLTKAEIQMIVENRHCAGTIVEYRRQRKTGIIQNDSDGWDWASACAFHLDAYSRLQKEFGRSEQEIKRYIIRQSKRRDIGYRNLIYDYADYLGQITTLNIPLDNLDIIEPHDLNNAHARLSARLRKNKKHHLTPQFRIRRHILDWTCFESDGLFIRPVLSAEEIIQEGEEMHNCVAGYAERHCNGETAILVIRRKNAPRDSYHTVELDEKNLVIRQCRSYRNGEKTEEVRQFIKKWMAYLIETRGVKERIAA